MKQNWKYSQKQREMSKGSNSKSKLINQIRCNTVEKNNAIDLEKSNLDDEKYKKLYKKIKKEFDAVSSKYGELKTKINNNEDLSLKVKIDYLKTENYNLNQSIKEMKNQLIELKKLYDDECNKANNYKQSMLLLDKEKSNLSEGYSNIRDKLEDQEKKNRDLQRRIAKYHSFTYAIQMTEISDLNDKLKIITKDNSTKDEKIKELELKLLKYEEMNPHFILNNLIQGINKENAHLYHQVEVLTRKYNEVLRKVFEESFNETTDIKSETIYGYVKEKSEDFIFIDLNKTEYQINAYIGVLEDEKPSAAYLNQDGTVDIYWYYKSEKIMQYDVMHTMERSKSEPISQQDIRLLFEQLGNFNVTIISTRNGRRYRDRLRYHGVNAIYVDPFEKSLIYVRNAIRKSDIVVICTENLPKNLYSTIENDNGDKYHYLKNHNEDIVFETVKMAAERMGLINSE